MFVFIDSTIKSNGENSATIFTKNEKAGRDIVLQLTRTAIKKWNDWENQNNSSKRKGQRNND